MIERLVKEARRGKIAEEDFRRLFECYQPQIRRMLPSRFLDPEERRDLIQEVFLAVYRGMERCPIDAFEAWLGKITRNTFLNWQQRKRQLKRRGNEISLDDLPLSERFIAKDASALSRMIAHERQLELYRAIAELPPQMRRCVLLRVTQDLSIEEVARALRVSPGTVKAHLFAAKKKLRQSLSDRFQVDF